MSDTRSSTNPRAERSRQTVLTAARDPITGDAGVPGLTVEAVAARSGVAKTTIYRQWRDKWELALDAVMIDMLPRFAYPTDVGDTRSELGVYMDSVIDILTSAPTGPAMQALVSQIATDPVLSEEYRTRVVEPRRSWLAPVVERAIARGDLRPDTDVRLVHELMVGPAFYRLLLSGGPLDRSVGAALVDAVLAAF